MIRIWRWALRLLPRPFRKRHAEEMSAVLQEHLRGKGRWGRLVVHVRALVDLIWTVARQRTPALRTDRQAVGSGRPSGIPGPHRAGPGEGWGTWMDGWSRDLGYAVRTLVRRPGFTAVAVITMALGTGVTTAMGSLAYTVLLAPSPYEAPDEIVQIAVETEEGRRTVMVPTRDLRVLRETDPDYLTLGVAGFRDVAVGDVGAPERVRGTIVTASTLPMLGVSPLLGRLPDAADDVPGGPCVTVLSHELWKRRFDASPDVAGSAVRLDGEPCVVRAVMPEGFAFPAPYYASGDLWLLAGPSGVDWDSASGWFMAFGRLESGVGPGVARERLSAVPLADEAEDRFTAMRWAEPIRDNARQRLLVLLAGAVLVLVIACVNLVTLQLGRNVERRREIATRTALGASAGRLLRLMGAETTVLTALGAAGGLVVATVSVDLILTLRSFYIPRMQEVTVDGTAVLICVSLAALAGLASGGIPALVLWTRRGTGVSRGLGRGLSPEARIHRHGRILVTVETALAILLLSGAALLLRSYGTLTALDPGFDTAGLVHARMTPPQARYRGDTSLTMLFREVEARIRALPDVREVALANVPPGVGAGPDRTFEIVGHPPEVGDQELRTVWRSVSPSYFRTLQIPLIRGGGLDEHRGTPRAVVVNESFVRRFLPGSEALGQVLRPVQDAGADKVWRIVGVVGDVHEEYAHSSVPPAVYVRYGDAPVRSMAVLARARGDAMSVTAPVREATAAVDPDLPLYAFTELDTLLEGEHDLNRLAMTLLGIFATTALLLAVAGIYGVVAHLVGRRLREMGIRIALGALGTDVVRLVVVDSFGFVLLGATIGVGTSALLGGHLQNLTPTWVGVEIGVLAAATSVVSVIALVAAWVPARRAASADPVSALRAE